MRVLNVVTTGEARFFQNQVSVLKRQGVDGSVVQVPGERDFTEENTDGRSPVDYLRLHPRVWTASAGSFDLLHANYGLTGPAALAQTRLPVVLSLWGSDLFSQFAPLSRLCARLSDAVIVMSEGMADALGEDCHVIPHGVDLELFRPMDRARARESVGWPAEGRDVLFPYPPTRTVKDYPRAERIADRVNRRVDDEVTLRTLYGVPHEEMPTYVNAADALLLTSRHEGSPNSVKEAMACNVPVVSTDVGDVRERLDGVAPSTVGRTDTELVEGLADVLRQGGRSNGREHVREVSLDRMGERIREVYRSVLLSP
jgi:glycosyltransferase involved in cell wall biosynthesis